MAERRKIEVTETFDGKRYSNNSPREWDRTFMVTGAANDFEAVNASDDDTGFRIPVRNDRPSPTSPLACLGSRVVAQLGPFTWIVSSRYEVPPEGQFVDIPEDPLEQPIEVEINTAFLSVPVDTDLDGRPIVNTAGDPFEPPSRRVAYKQVNIYRNEAVYDSAKAEAFENTTNLTAVTLLGFLHCRPKHLIMNSYEPVGRVRMNARYVPVKYSFDLIQTRTLGLYPWEHPFLNVGSNGWRTESSKKVLGPFVTQPGGTGTSVQIFTQPVRLNGDGQPIAAMYPDLKVGKEGPGGDTFAAAPEAIPERLRVIALAVEKLPPMNTATPPTTPPADGGGYRLIYRQFGNADHNALGL